MRLHRRGGGGRRPNKTQRTHARTSCVSGSSASPQSSGASSSSSSSTSGPWGGEAVPRLPARSSVMGALAVVTVVAGCWLLAAGCWLLSLSLSLSPPSSIFLCGISANFLGASLSYARNMSWDGGSDPWEGGEGAGRGTESGCGASLPSRYRRERRGAGGEREPGRSGYARTTTRVRIL